MNEVVKNRDFIIICDSVFIPFVSELLSFITYSKQKLLTFFGISEIDRIKIILYKDISAFCCDSGKIIKTNKIGGLFGYNRVMLYANLENVSHKDIYFGVCHEISHVIYQQYVQEKGKINRVIWFDEGLAQNLSREKDRLLDDCLLSEFLDKKIFSKDKVIPKINYFDSHGNSFGSFVDMETKRYDGYDWSYLMIRYLMEVMEKEKFDRLMRSRKEIKSLGDALILETSDYFKCKVKRKGESYDKI